MKSNWIHCSLPITALFATLSLSSMPSHALQMTATNSWTLNGVSTTDTDGPASSGSVDVLGSDYDTGGQSSIFYHTFGNQNGYFGSRSSGEGYYENTGIYTFTEDYIATGGTATFDFNIIPGELSIYANGLTGSEVLFAGYELNILLNGNTIWSSSAELSKTASGTTFTSVGTSIGSYDSVNSPDSYSWGTFNASLDLGSFNAGDLFNITYNLSTTASGNIILDTSGCYNYGYGFRDVAAITIDNEIQVEGGACGSTARIGDPIGASQGNSFNITGASTNVVPEPGILALFASSLLGFGYLRRKA